MDCLDLLDLPRRCRSLGGVMTHLAPLLLAPHRNVCSAECAGKIDRRQQYPAQLAYRIQDRSRYVLAPVDSKRRPCQRIHCVHSSL